MPLETTELVEKCATGDKLAADQDAFSLSATGSHNSHSTHSRGSQRNYDKLTFPRKELQTLGMLGKLWQRIVRNSQSVKTACMPAPGRFSIRHVQSLEIKSTQYSS